MCLPNCHITPDSFSDLHRRAIWKIPLTLQFFPRKSIWVLLENSNFSVKVMPPYPVWNVMYLHRSILSIPFDDQVIFKNSHFLVKQLGWWWFNQFAKQRKQNRRCGQKWGVKSIHVSPRFQMGIASIDTAQNQSDLELVLTYASTCESTDQKVKQLSYIL